MDEARFLVPALYGLALEPPTLRPGGVTRVTLAIRNRTAVVAPALSVRFVLPAELEALDPTSFEVEPLAAGAEHVVVTRARLGRDARDGASAHVQAVVAYDGREVGTNIATATVRAEPVLSGPGTGFTLADRGDGTVRFDVRVRNDGDGAAADVVVAIPPQPGLAASGHVTLALGTIPAGEERSAGIALGVGCGAGDGRIVVDGVVVRDARGRRSPIPGAATVTLAPRLLPPHFRIEDDGSRVAARLTIAADGPVHLNDVEVDVVVPPGFRLAPASVCIDDVPVGVLPRGRGKRVASMRSANGRTTIALPRVIAGNGSVLAFDVHRSGASGRLAVHVRAGGQAAAELGFDLPSIAPRPPRITLIAAPPALTPGGRATATIELAAIGAAPVCARLALAGADLVAVDGRRPADIVLAPGEVRDLSCEIVDAHAHGGEVVLTCTSDAGETQLNVPLLIRGVEDDGASVDVDAAPLEPFVDAELHMPARATAGATVDAQVTIVVRAATKNVRLTLPQTGPLRYVAGSTRIDDHEVLDGGEPALVAGLVLRDLEAGTAMTIAWRSMVAADAAGCIEAAVYLELDDVPIAITPATIEVVAPDVFASRPAGLGFHVDAALAPVPSFAPERVTLDTVHVPTLTPLPAPAAEATFASPVAAWTTMWSPVSADAAAELSAMDFRLAVGFDAERATDALRLLEGGATEGYVSHVLALRVLLPADVTPFDTAIAARLDDLRGAVRDVLDRLFVKIRIPAYDVSASDCEDTPARAALLALIDVVPAAASDPHWYERLTTAPLGDPAALALLADLLSGDGAEAGDAAARYAAAIGAMLRRSATLPAAAFDDALARGQDATLDLARAEFVTALGRLASEFVR